MRRLAAFLALLGLFACAPAAWAGVVSWHASSGVLPSDPSIPQEHRFWLSGEPSFASMSGGLLNLNDTSESLHVGFVKSDMDPAEFEGDWAYHGELRINPNVA